jgi:sugar lactone lactonase YvrE
MKRHENPNGRRNQRSGQTPNILATAVATAVITVWMGLMGAVAQAAEPVFEPLYESAPRALAKTRIVHEESKGVFFENIAAADDGALYITSLFDGRLLRVTSQGENRVFAQLPGAASGIVNDGEGGFLVGGWGKDERRVLWRVNATGNVSEAAALPEAALPNGIAALDTKKTPGVFLVTDSVKGLIWRVDTKAGTVGVWSDAAALGGFDPQIKPAIPAANGIKLHGGYAYIANMQLRQLVRIPVKADGSAGNAEIYVKNVFLDDFAIDAKGRIFAATHPYNGVVRIDPDRKITVIASFDQGLQGATSVAFGRGKGDTGAIYVTTNGGVYVPPSYGITGGKLVRIDIR